MRNFIFSHLFFIAKRIFFNKDDKKQLFSPAIHIATINMSLSLVVIILSVAIVLGFRKEIQNKITGFNSHIRITNSCSNNIFYEFNPLTVDTILLDKIKQIPNVSDIQSFAIKPAIIKTKNNFQEVLLKGIDKNFNLEFLKKKIIEGDTLSLNLNFFNSDVIISKYIIDKLNLKINDTFICYFIQNSITKIKKCHIIGIYQTDFLDYDKLFIICNISQIRSLNNWNENIVSGYEIWVNNFRYLDQTLKTINDKLSTQHNRFGNDYYVRSIKQLNSSIFSWLDILDTNAIIILILMLIVASFSMISALLVIILEYANMIGLLKAMGENNTNIRKIFFYISFFLIGRGLIFGNIIALSICFFQKYTGILKLNPKIYYLSIVPIHLNIIHMFLINFCTIIITLLTLILPSYLVAKIPPIKTIRIE
ncbi:MAG: FtsX-like permease family protein [Bacteroidales bacterium OttesenSCG-928-I14]|jgi:lipoprotein-releasing system permease protein|nr:FtsX-like permease family protein [Bacteroidales bacterium OttesenSCG-928-I14]